jgi:hypothetical protein
MCNGCELRQITRTPTIETRSDRRHVAAQDRAIVGPAQQAKSSASL